MQYKLECPELDEECVKILVSERRAMFGAELHDKLPLVLQLRFDRDHINRTLTKIAVRLRQRSDRRWTVDARVLWAAGSACTPAAGGAKKASDEELALLIVERDGRAAIRELYDAVEPSSDFQCFSDALLKLVRKDGRFSHIDGFISRRAPGR
ncbi:hypothetical protein QY049_20590 [Bradyrhizobium sp. WYCCWR 13022]|nr:hypothetical protein [Bradyrhizobium sp. WYCCWR 13022]